MKRIICFCSLFLLLTGCSSDTDDGKVNFKVYQYSYPTNNLVEIDEGKDFTGKDGLKHTFTSTQIICEDNFDIHTDDQNLLINGDRWSVPNDDICGVRELSKPNALHISWNTSISDDYSPEKYVFQLSERGDMVNSKVIETENNYVDVVNLKVSTIYYCNIGNVCNGTTLFCKPIKFHTKDTIIRNISIDGVTNCRDMGGYTSIYGKVQQGRIFRTAALEGITEQGKIEAKNDINFKSEIDLRNDGAYNVSPLGDNVALFRDNVSMSFDGAGKIATYHSQIKNIFKIFAKKENYPIVFHCAAGADRTGMIGFLLNCLLGVSETDMEKDYLFTNYGNIGGGRTATNIDMFNIKSNYLGYIKEFEGNNLSEKMANYLMSDKGNVSLTNHEVEAVLDNMLNQNF